jgi:NTE family protein
MNVVSAAATPAARAFDATRAPGQIVLVLQGGGALGAYQAGVYQALHEAGIEPDWVIGTSIGAINASLIAGNEVTDRLERLREFWRRVERPEPAIAGWPWRAVFDVASDWMTLVAGVPGFFVPDPAPLWGPHWRLGPEQAGYYSTAPLGKMLSELVDPRLLNRGSPRITVGAANVRTSEMRYFDSRDAEITVRHIMASGALPPAFPAVRIGDEFYWDGGILSNTPTEAIFDDNPRRNSLVFAVHVWSPEGSVPEAMWDVFTRQKEIQYSSRVATHIVRQRQLHRLRHVVSELARRLPEAERSKPEVRELAAYGCLTRMHVVRLLAPRLVDEDHTKDIDFSASGIRMRWEAGYAATMRAIERAPWEDDGDPLEGVILHEPMGMKAADREC